MASTLVLNAEALVLISKIDKNIHLESQKSVQNIPFMASGAPLQFPSLQSMEEIRVIFLLLCFKCLGLCHDYHFKGLNFIKQLKHSNAWVVQLRTFFCLWYDCNLRERNTVLLRFFVLGIELLQSKTLQRVLNCSSHSPFLFYVRQTKCINL